ncbi:MAG TPA: CocE/NonD family hydrolase [Rhodospirillales bacterium]|nr:CocE/NonD family hydrolase [Rhodospirillales bacterium]|tara:strand:+ start:57 stop:1727 length:1671 start_codon:yes stop_codon:yes gene_type:complete
MAKKGAKQKHRYVMKVEEPVFITMRDGTPIACRIYRPDTAGRFPVLFAASPYQYETDDLPHSTMFLWREVGPVEWYVRDQGYAYVHMDVRGSGQSGGVYNFLDREEQQDYYECIEWVGRQDWCNGKVGGIGQSYYAWSQWFMGIVNPPSLKCIAPYDGAVDPYRGTAYHGGIYCDFMAWWYQLVRVNNLHRAANGLSGQYMPLDLAGEMARHQTYDDWWRERCPWERLDEIKVPLLSIGHWGKMGLHLRGNILGYENVKTPKKLVVTGAKDVFEAHDQFDHISYHEAELLPFYDHYLKGKKNKWAERPNVRLHVGGRNEWREEDEWPLKRAKFQHFYLNERTSKSVTSVNDGLLTTDAPKANGGSTSYDYPDPNWKLGTVGFSPQGPDPVRGVLTFTTEPLKKHLEIVGPIILELHASSSNIDTDFIIKISDQYPQSMEDRTLNIQPLAIVVSKGWLRASHREKDKILSSKLRPIYTHANPKPIEPGIVYVFEIEVMPCAHEFKANHRIRLEIVNGDSPLTDSLFTHQYLYYKVGTDTIWHNDKHPSRLLLPIVTK